MDSQGSKLKEESSEMVQTTASAIDALPTTLSSLSLDAPKPKTFNDLPDELLDDIARFTRPADLRNLALVERRCRDPAYRHLLWRAKGFKKLMDFAELLLTQPRLGRLVRHAHLDGGEATQDTSRGLVSQTYSSLTARAIQVIVEELPNLQSLLFGYAPLMAAIGELERLQRARLGVQTSFLEMPEFSLALPAFRKSQFLGVALRIHPTRPLPLLPRCSIIQVELFLTGANEDRLGTLLAAIAADSRRLKVYIRDDSQPPRLTVAELGNACQPYIAGASYLSWHTIVEGPFHPYRPTLPSPVAWLLLEFSVALSPSSRMCSTHFWSAKEEEQDACIADFEDDMEKCGPLGMESGRVQAGGKVGWGKEHIARLHEIARRSGASVEWC